jgi:pentapeptide MXKDX repeat protein
MGSDGRAAHCSEEENIMTKSLMLPLAMAMCIGFAPLAVAQTMAPQDSKMSNPSGTMAKPDAMGKTDSMAKPADKTDTMKTTDGKTDNMKKDGMAK